MASLSSFFFSFSPLPHGYGGGFVPLLACLPLRLSVLFAMERWINQEPWSIVSRFCAALLGTVVARSNGLVAVAVHVADVRSKRIPEFLKTLKGKG